MEKPTSFDLNCTIQRWREGLAKSPAFRRENLDELELHLRDSIAALQMRNLSLEEAFLVAVKRLGKGGSLEKEYAKVNARAVWLDRSLWMLIGVQIWMFVSGPIFSAIHGGLFFGLTKSNYDFLNHGRTMLITAFALVHLIAFAACLAICWWLVYRKGEALAKYAGKLLGRLGVFPLTSMLLCVFLLSGLFVRLVLPVLLIHSVGPAEYGLLAFAQARSDLAMVVVQPAVLLTLTLILARRRLQTTEV